VCYSWCAPRTLRPSSRAPRPAGAGSASSCSRRTSSWTRRIPRPPTLFRSPAATPARLERKKQKREGHDEKHSRSITTQFRFSAFGFQCVGTESTCLGADAVEELAVVADDHDGEALGRQEALEPLHRLQVQVVLVIQSSTRGQHKNERLWKRWSPSKATELKSCAFKKNANGFRSKRQLCRDTIDQHTTAKGKPRRRG